MRKEIRGKWSKGDEVKGDGEIGELIIDGNNISFHMDGYGNILTNTYVTKSDEHYYKVYTYGQEDNDDSGYFYRVAKVFQYNGIDYKEFTEENINGITSVSFKMPELADWLRLNSIDFGENGAGELILCQLKIKPIVIKKKEPNISIEYEPNFPVSEGMVNTELTLRNVPRVFIKYDIEVDDTRVTNDICKVMRFFGLLIGRISYADDIRLEIARKSYKMWLFINNDFSYNNHSNAYYMGYRISFDAISENIQYYFEKWYKFSEDEDYIFLQNVFFAYTGKRSTKIEDIFLVYCRFLEGYDLRVMKDEDKADILYKKLCNILKSDEAKELFSQSFKEAYSSYKHKSVAKWISTGFLERISLEDRIKRLDEKFLKIISANSNAVIGINDPDQFFSKITKTRNYYSHFKPNDSGILNFSEMYRTIDILEALVITILLSETGIPIEIVKNFMIQDDRYWSLMTHQRESELQKD